MVQCGQVGQGKPWKPSITYLNTKADATSIDNRYTFCISVKRELSSNTTEVFPIVWVGEVTHLDAGVCTLLLAKVP